MDSIKQLTVLSLCMATVPVFLYVISHRPPTPYEEPAQDPWTFSSGGLTCDTPPYFVGDWCYRPEVLSKEFLRRKFNEQGLCDSETGRESIEVFLKMYPNVCSRDKLADYDEAVVRTFTPILEAMQRDQGIELPELSADNYRACALDRYEQLYKNDPPIMFEMVYRKCAKGIDVAAVIR